MLPPHSLLDQAKNACQNSFNNSTIYSTGYNLHSSSKLCRVEESSLSHVPGLPFSSHASVNTCVRLSLPRRVLAWRLLSCFSRLVDSWNLFVALLTRSNVDWPTLNKWTWILSHSYNHSHSYMHHRLNTINQSEEPITTKLKLPCRTNWRQSLTIIFYLCSVTR